MVNRQFKSGLYSSGKFGDSIIPPNSVTFLHDPHPAANKLFLTNCEICLEGNFHLPEILQVSMSSIDFDDSKLSVFDFLTSNPSRITTAGKEPSIKTVN